MNGIKMDFQTIITMKTTAIIAAKFNSFVLLVECLMVVVMYQINNLLRSKPNSIGSSSLLLLLSHFDWRIKSNVVLKNFKRNLVTDLNDPKLSYEFGRAPSTKFSYSPLTIGELLKRSCQAQSDSLAFIVAHQNIQKTFGEFEQDVNKLAAGLQAIGCRRGSMVGLWAFNCYEWLLVQYATAKLGSILVAINPGYKEAEMIHCMNLTKVDTLIMNQSFGKFNLTKVLESISPGIMTEAQGHRVQSKSLPSLENLLMIDPLPEEPEDYAPPNVCRLSELMSGQDTTELDRELVKDPCQFDDVINVLFTSGTTGMAKGAMATHYNLIQNARFVSSIFFQPFYGTEFWDQHDHHQSSAELKTKRPIVCLPNPMYHVMGTVLGSLATLNTHSTLVLTAPMFNITKTLDAIQRFQCNYYCGTPTMWSDLLLKVKSDRKSNYDLSSFQYGIMSGANCPSQLVKNAFEILPSLRHIFIPYGTTETGPVATCNRITDSFQKQSETVGRPLPLVEVKVVDIKTGRIQPKGQSGEICIRSHGVFPGYMNQPDKTREVVDDNFWYHSGDVGLMDEDGYLIINGRIKEMIIRGGENIYPREVEELISQLTEDIIEDVQVVGIPDERLGEELVAFIKLKSNQTIDGTKLKEFLKTKISHFKVPKHIMFVDDFPRTSNGKIRKVELKRIAEDNFVQEK